MQAPLRPCPSPRCPNYAGRCPDHVPVERAAWDTPRKAQQPRLRGVRLQRARVRLFVAEPFCRQCRSEGRQVLAAIRDHVIPLAEGGSESESNENCQPLCRTCSDRKTREESRRGIARG